MVRGRWIRLAQGRSTDRADLEQVGYRAMVTVPVIPIRLDVLN